MRSPGAPSHRREIERRFWEQIATGITSQRAAKVVGVSQAVGTRWFRHRGGMPLFISKPLSAKYLSFAEREEIGLLCVQGLGMREIARRVGRSPSTVSRELRRDAATRGGQLEYWPSVAQWKAEPIARRPKPAKLVTNPRLRGYATTSKTAWKAKSMTLMVGRLPALDRHRLRGATNPIVATVDGLMAGRPNRLPIGCRSTSRSTNPCISFTKPSTKPFTLRGEALSVASW